MATALPMPGPAPTTRQTWLTLLAPESGSLRCYPTTAAACEGPRRRPRTACSQCIGDALRRRLATIFRRGEAFLQRLAGEGGVQRFGERRQRRAALGKAPAQAGFVLQPLRDLAVGGVARRQRGVAEREDQQAREPGQGRRREVAQHLVQRLLDRARRGRRPARPRPRSASVRSWSATAAPPRRRARW